MAIRSLRLGPKIEALKDRLNHVRSNLMISLIVFMTMKRDGDAVSMVPPPRVEIDNTAASPSPEASMAREVREILTTLSDKTVKRDLFSSHPTDVWDDKIRTDLEKLIHRIANDDEGTESISNAINAVGHGHRQQLQRMSERLERSLTVRNNDLEALSHKINILVESMKSETMPQRKVLDSLYYMQMDERRNRVNRAHSQTLQWIFRPKAEDDTLWDDFVDWLCSPSAHAVYWIRGKAGSGKSTLMRELDQKVSEEQHDLHDWARGCETLHASSYLWNAGSVTQKSLTGLLLSLVYQLFRQRADLIEISVSSHRWQTALEPGAKMRTWAESELQDVLRTFVRQTCPDAKLLLLVDGLDEYDGSDEQRMDMISFFQGLTAIDGVKVCVSSRPWVIYQDAFKCCPQLRLEELTKKDISLYVHDQLLGSDLFRVQQRRYPKLLTNISHEIIQKADGVFLWVRLVVRELLKRVRDGAFASELMNQLHAVPPDLDDYFMRMMETIEPRYRQDASTMLQIALCSMDFTLDQTSPNVKLIAGPALLLLHLQYLHEEDAPDFVTSPDFRPLRYDDDEEVSYWVETLDRRLTSRCMGLLEAGKLLPGQSLWEIKVDFLHRTARDFMCTREAQSIFHRYTDGPYDAHLYRCNVLVADIISLHQLPSSQTVQVANLLNVASFLGQIQNRTCVDSSTFALYEKLMVYVETILRDTAIEGNIFSVEPRFDEIAEEFLSNYKAWEDLAMNMARRIGWKDYVESRTLSRLQELEQLTDSSHDLPLGTAPSSGFMDAFFSARSNLR